MTLVQVVAHEWMVLCGDDGKRWECPAASGDEEAGRLRQHERVREVIDASWLSAVLDVHVHPGRRLFVGGAGGGKGAGVLEFDAAALGVCRDETKPESGREKVIVGAAPCCLETKGDLKGFFPCMLLIPTLVSRLFFTNGVTGICVGEDITFRP